MEEKFKKRQKFYIGRKEKNSQKLLQKKGNSTIKTNSTSPPLEIIVDWYSCLILSHLIKMLLTGLSTFKLIYNHFYHTFSS